MLSQVSRPNIAHAMTMASTDEALADVCRDHATHGAPWTPAPSLAERTARGAGRAAAQSAVA